MEGRDFKKEKATGAKEGGRAWEAEDNGKIKTNGFITLFDLPLLYLE